MLEHNPLIYIAIPFYNSESFLEKAIVSIVNQTYKNWRLLLIDDGSTDNSLAIARRYESDDRINIISDGLNKGLVSRLNESVNIAFGDYYARMDADDIMHPFRLEKQIEYMLSHSDVDVLGTSAYTIDENDNIHEFILYDNDPKVDPFHPCFLHPSVIGKINWFKNNPYSNEYERMEDFELWLRSSKHSHYHNLPHPLMFYREFGLLIPQKYLATQKSALRLAIRGKSYGLTYVDRIEYFTQTIIKCIVCKVLDWLGKSELQIKLRRRETKTFDKCKAHDDLVKAISKNYEE